MNITDQQKKTLAAEATKIFIQDPARENFPKMLEISNILGKNGEYIFKGPPELIITVDSVFEETIIAYHSHFSSSFSPFNIALTCIICFCVNQCYGMNRSMVLDRVPLNDCRWHKAKSQADPFGTKGRKRGLEWPPYFNNKIWSFYPFKCEGKIFVTDKS